MGFARLAEDGIRSLRDRPPGSALTTSDKLVSSVIGGALGCWNHVGISPRSTPKHTGGHLP